MSELTNEQLVELLSYYNIYQTQELPPHLEALKPPAKNQLIRLIKERLKPAKPTPKPLKPTPVALAETKGTRALVDPNSNIKFDHDFLERAFEVHGSNYFTVRLKHFQTTGDLSYDIQVVMAAIGHIFNIVEENRNWPLYIPQATRVFHLLVEGIKNMASLGPIMEAANPVLIVGDPTRIDLKDPVVNPDQLRQTTELYRELKTQYPGWMIHAHLEEHL
jgi:hypothetical protein